MYRSHMAAVDKFGASRCEPTTLDTLGTVEFLSTSHGTKNVLCVTSNIFLGRRLCLAAADDDVELINSLVAGGVAAGAVEPLHQVTALHLAARTGKLAAIGVLASLGANVHAVDGRGLSLNRLPSIVSTTPVHSRHSFIELWFRPEPTQAITTSKVLTTLVNYLMHSHVEAKGERWRRARPCGRGPAHAAAYRN